MEYCRRIDVVTLFVDVFFAGEANASSQVLSGSLASYRQAVFVSTAVPLSTVDSRDPRHDGHIRQTCQSASLFCYNTGIAER